MKIALLTSQNQWLENYIEEFSEALDAVEVYFSHNDIRANYDVLFILGYNQIIQKDILDKNKHNIIVHESDLPKGKGWAPLFWQVLEGKNEIVFTMFEANLGIDDGDVYMKDTLNLTGYELNDTLREKQAQKTIEMCIEFVTNYDKYRIPISQTGEDSYYRKRNSESSQLDIKKTLEEQFNLLRVVNNNEYPAFFEINGNKYILKIELEKNE